MSIGTVIASYRKKLGLTQDALAQKLGVTNQAVSKWESDQSCPDIQLLPLIGDIFEISMDELFERAPKTEPREVNKSVLLWPDDNVLRVVMYVGHKIVGAGPAGLNCEFSYEAPVDGVISSVSISCGDVSGDVDAGGHVKCGDVGGDVDAGASVSCGDVGGDVDAGTDVTCGDVGGDVDAGANVSCGDVGGDVDAGLGVTCGDVGGDVDAGLGVECGSVEGDIDASGIVTIR